MKRKAQIKLGESIAIIIVFFFIVIFALVFYSKIEKGSIEDEADENAQLRSINIAQIVSFLPEVQCRFNNIPKDDCFDILKIKYFQKFMSSSDEAKLYYYDILYYSNINISQIYPPSDNNWTLYQRIPDSYSKKDPTYIPISLFNASDNTYAVGLMTVEVYT